MLYILTNSSTSTAILHDLKNEAHLYNAYWLLSFLPLSKNCLEAQRNVYALTYRMRATLTNYMCMRNKTNMAEFVYW